MRLLLFLSVILPLFFLPACGNSQPSPEDLQKIQQLQNELEEIRNDIAQSEEQAAQLSGGLIKVLMEARLEILKTNKALVSQRIHAIESGTKITFESNGITPSPEEASRLEQEIQKQEEELRIAKEEAAKYSGGLIAAMKQSAVATQEQTLALLKQRYLSAKYGLALPKIQQHVNNERIIEKSDASKKSKAIITSENKNKQNKIVGVKLLNKKFTEQEYQEFIFFDIEFKAIELDKPARAIKGTLNLQDIFGDAKFRIGWTINDPMKPGEIIVEHGTGFKFNQFIGSHQWVRATELKDMTVSFTVKNILYQDGTHQEF